MTKSWSSFEGQQLLQENWRNFLSEESETAKFLRSRGMSTDDHWEDAEGQEGDPQASDYPDVSHGLDSKDNTDSLKQVLGRLTPPLKPDRIQTLIDVIAQIAGDEGIMLELSLKGLNSEQDRIIDSAATAQILNKIAEFNLPDAEKTALIKALNYWGRVNSVKFTAPPVAATSVVNTTDPRDDVSQGATATSDETPDDPPDEESTVFGFDALGPGPEPEPVYLAGPNGETFVGHLNDTWEEWASADGTPFYWNKDEKQSTWDRPGQTGEEEPDTPADEAEDEEGELSTLKKVELGIDMTLNSVGALGMIPWVEASGVPTIATLASLIFNLGRGKMSDALLDVVALAPVVGKASKAGKLGKAMKLAMAGKNFMAGRYLIKLFKNADNARTAIKTMKSAKAAKDLAAAGSSAKELLEGVSEDWISTAIYKKQDGGDYWIDYVLDGITTLSKIPGIPDGIGGHASELKQTVAKLRKVIPPPPTDPADSPEPGSAAPSELASRPRATRTTPRIGTQNRGPTGPLQETYDRWQIIAGINKRVL